MYDFILVQVLFADGSFGKNVIIFGEGPTQGLDNTRVTAEGIYPVSFTQHNKRFILSLHFNETNGFLFVNATKI